MLGVEDVPPSASLTPLLSEHETDASAAMRTCRLAVAVAVVTMGSSFQFGFGTGSFNNLEVTAPASLATEGTSVPVLAWSIVVAGFAVGGLIGSVVTALTAGLLGRRTMLLLTNILVLVSSALYLSAHSCAHASARTTSPR